MRHMLNQESIKALTFDVFGTTVDWYNAIVREGQALAPKLSQPVDWDRFANAWRAGFLTEGALPFVSDRTPVLPLV